MKRLFLGSVLALSLVALSQTSALAGNRGPSTDKVDCSPTVPEPATCVAGVAALGFAWALRKRLN